MITQLFFDNDDYFQFRDHLTKLGVKVPLIAGHDFHPERHGDQEIHGAVWGKDSVGARGKARCAGADDAAAAEFGIEYCTKQCEELLKAGVPGLHFYTLNKAASTVRVLQNLKLV